MTGEGEALAYTWGQIDGVDVEIVVQFARPPTSSEAAAVEQVIRDWDQQGVQDGYGPRLFGEGPGWLHGLYQGAEFGARWNGTTLQWLEDFGSANPAGAADALAQSIANWSRQSGLAVVRLQFGS